MIEGADETVKQEIEDLIAGGTIEKPIHEDLTKIRDLFLQKKAAG